MSDGEAIRRIVSGQADLLADKARYGFDQAETAEEIAEVFRQVESDAGLLVDMVESVAEADGE